MYIDDKIKQIWQIYFIGIVTEHMNNGGFKIEKNYYSYVELFFERIAIWLLCFAPKSVYLILALFFTMFGPAPIGIGAIIIIVFRMPSSKSPIASQAMDKFWYKQFKSSNGRSFI